MRTILAVLMTISAATFVNCQKSTDSDTIQAAFLLGGTNRLGGKAARSGTTGAVAAVSATAGGLSTGASAYLLPGGKPQFMLALLRGMRHSRGTSKLLAALRLRKKSPVMPATFTCAGAPSSGDCSQGGDGNPYVMSGTETCEDGMGLVTANNVDVVLDDDGTIFTYEIDNGSFTYSGGCGTYSIDFENYPDYKLNSLSGSVTTTGTLASTVSETSNGGSSTISGFTIAHMQMVTTSADNFTVNGGSPLVMDLRIDSTDSENIIFDPIEDEIILGTASTALTMNGTVNGQAVNSSISVTLTLP